MIFISLISSIITSLGIVIILNLNPFQIAEDIINLTKDKNSLRYRVNIAQEKRKQNKIIKYIKSIYEALKTTHSEKKFAILCIISILAIALGFVLSTITSMPVFMIACIAISIIFPYLYANKILSNYTKDVDMEIETAISIISTTYQDTDNIISAVEQTLPYIHEPIKEYFKDFLTETKYIDSNVRNALINLKLKIKNEIFQDWVDNIILVQDNSAIKVKLMKHAEKLSALRTVNTKLETIITKPRKDFFIMLFLSFAIFPILYIMQPDWFPVFIDTWYGNTVLCLIVIIDLIAVIKVINDTRPIKYRR